MILVVGQIDDELVPRISDWLMHDAPHRRESGIDVPGVGALRPLTGDRVQWGGYKKPECWVWGGVLNHADLNAVRAAVRSQPWQSPERVQLLLQDQEDSTFGLFMIRNGQIELAATSDM